MTRGTGASADSDDTVAPGIHSERPSAAHPQADPELRSLRQALAERTEEVRELRARLHRLEHADAEAALQRSEAELRAVIECTPDIVFTVDPQLRIRFANRIPAGLTVERALGTSALDYVLPEYRDLVEQTIQRVLATGKPDFYEIQARGPNDSAAWYVTRLVPLPIGEGKRHVLLITQDVTERKRAEEESHQARELFAHLFHLSPVATSLASLPECRFLDVNAAAETLMGRSRQELLGRQTGGFPFFAESEEHRQVSALLAAQGRVTGQEIRVRTHSGGERVCVLYIETLQLQGQRYALTQLVDISSQKQTEWALRETELKYRTLVEQSPVVVYVAESNERWRYISPQVERILGYSAAAYQANPQLWKDQIHLADREHVERAFRRVDECSGRLSVDYRMATGDGRLIWVRDEGMAVVETATGQTLIYGVVYDITERKEAELALQRSEQVIREAQAIGNLGSWTADLRTGTFEASPESARLVGSSSGQHTFQELLSVIHPDDRAHVEKAWATTLRGEVLDIEHRVMLGGDTRWLRVKAVATHDHNGEPLSAVGITQDITERKAANVALQQAAARLQLLADASAAFAEAGLDEAALLESLTQRTADALGASCFVRLRGDNDPWLVVAAAHDPDPAIQKMVEPMFSRTRVHIDDSHPAALVVRSGQPRLNPAIDLDALRATLAPEFWPVLELVRPHSELITPLRTQGTIVGCLALIRHTPGQPAFTQDDLTLAQDLADRAGLALANARLYRDVQQAQRAAQQAHAQLNALITSLPTGIAYFGPDLRYQLVNPALAAINGRGTAEHLGQPVSAIVPDLAPQIEPLVHEVLATGKAVRNLEVQGEAHPSGDGFYTWLVSYFPVPEPGGVITGVGVTLTDITAIRRTEAALQASTTKLQAALESMTDAIFISDAEGRLIEFNTAFARFHRFGSKHECPHNLDAYPRFLDVYLPTGEPAPEEQWSIARALRGETATNVEYTLRRKDTGETWVGSYSFAPIRAQDGAIVGSVVISRDITASKQAELRLRQSEARFATIFEHSPIALGISRLSDGTITDVNAAFLNLYGTTYEQVIGRTTLDLGLWAYPEDRQHVLEQIRSQRRIASFEAVAHTASGDERQVLLSGELVQIHDEPRVLMQIMDITALKVAQQELRELNQTLEERVRQRTAEVQDLYDNAPTGYYALDINGHFTSINQTLLNWLGSSREELLGRSFSTIIPPVHHDVFVAGFRSFQERGQLRDVEGELLRKDGRVFPVLINATAVYNVDGVYVSSRASVFDNAVRKQAEHALRESEEQNRLLFEEAPEAVALLDEHGRIVRANRALGQLVGHPVEHLLEQTPDALGLVSRAQIADIAAAVRPLAQHGPGEARAVVTCTRANGEARVVHARVFALAIRGQRHYLAAIHDITAERQTEEMLRLANAELARAARAKDEFLANMSHELRTPLNAILGRSESLQDAIYGPLTERQRNAISAIEAGGRLLLTLINDILDLAKVEAGRLELQTEHVLLHEVCQVSLLFVREQALKKRLRLDFHLNDQKARMEVDPTRLKQMLVNLLSNAVKFTPAGGMVGLDVTIDEEAGTVRFAVHDTGIGIAPEDLGRLFQPFSQLDPSLNREHEGTGLGLALVRRLAELHGGSVTVESTFGEGSCFTIALPYHDPLDERSSQAEAQPAQAAGSEPDAMDIRRGRILLAEDNEANSGALGDYLRARGYEVFVARDGHEALTRADEVRPELILMDIQMPRLDGLEATRRLRAQPAHATTPIIALTALAMPGDKERCLAAGATAYMTKPVSLRGLAETIQQLLEA